MHNRNDKAAWLHGPTHPCADPGPLPTRLIRLVLLGPPGAGKGTQAGLLVRCTGACHLSTGDVFRAAWSTPAAEVTPGMAHALAAMRNGELVCDETVVEIVHERAGCLVCPHGFILDGFPRTLSQARALDTMLAEAGVSLDAVINLAAADDVVVDRVSNRRVCRKCKEIWHTEFKPPRHPCVCDRCGAELIRRPDDEPAAIRTRLREYHATCDPLSEYYQSRGLLRAVDASATPDAVARAILQIVSGGD